MGARRNFSLGAKATPPFPISPFPFLSFPSPLHVVLPSLPSGHLKPAFGEGYIAKAKISCPAPSSPLLFPISFPSYILPFPYFPPFPSSPLSFPPFSLSFLPIGARGFAGAANKQRKLNYLKLHIQSTNRPRKWFSPVVGDNIIRDCVFYFYPKNPTTRCNFTKSYWAYYTLCVIKRGILGHDSEYLTASGGLRSLDPLYWGSVPEPRWGLPSLKPPVSSLSIGINSARWSYVVCK